MEDIMERLEAVQCIVSLPCDKIDAQCAYEELDILIPQIRKILSKKREALEDVLTVVKAAWPHHWYMSVIGEEITRHPTQRTLFNCP